MPSATDYVNMALHILQAFNLTQVILILGAIAIIRFVIRTFL